MLDIEWKAPALADLSTILDYIAEANPTAATALLDEIEAKIEDTAEHPKLCRPGRVASARELIAQIKATHTPLGSVV